MRASPAAGPPQGPTPYDDLPVELARAGWFGRFPAPTEAAYRSWLNEQIVPLARMVAVLSVPFWFLIPAVYALLPGVRTSPGFWALCLFNAALLVFALVVVLRHRHDQVVGFSVLGLVVIGGGSVYLMTTDEISGGPGTVAASAVFMTLLTAFMRLPLRSTAFVVLCLAGTATAILVDQLRSAAYTLDDVLPYLVYLGISGTMVLGISWATEAQLRAKFVDEQVIVRQQALLAESGRLIRRYVPASVAERIEHGDAVSVGTPERRRVTVLFSDVVGFTDLADRLDPEALAQVVDEYLASLAEIIERHRGTLNEFAGDGVMALFGAPAAIEPEDQVCCAVAAAREIQSTLPRLNRSWCKLGVEHDLQARVGINTGVLSIGSFGSEGRKTYTGIGLQTNIAARIQAHCDPGAILLSHTSWQLARERVTCEPRGEVAVKGVHFPIAVYAPLQEVPG